MNLDYSYNVSQRHESLSIVTYTTTLCSMNPRNERDNEILSKKPLRVFSDKIHGIQIAYIIRAIKDK